MTTVDNRDTDEMFRYLEARIEAFKRELDHQRLENAELTRLNLQLQEAIEEIRRKA